MVEELNEQQLKAVEFQGKHLLVIAGAGTGKTRTIIARAKHLLQQGVPANRILILSFTRKSAREIVERIKNEIGGLSITSHCKNIGTNGRQVERTLQG